MMTDENVRDLQAALQYIERHPEQHDQNVWICGSFACLAGWGVRLKYPDLKYPDTVLRNTVVLIDNRWCSVSDLASEIFGLDEAQAEQLFSASNTLTDLRAMVDLLIETRGECSDGELEDLAS